MGDCLYTRENPKFLTCITFQGSCQLDDSNVEDLETSSDFILGGSKSLQMVIAAMKLKDTYSLEEKL